ncbi:MAG: ABC transporter permease [Bacillota bacterium]
MTSLDTTRHWLKSVAELIPGGTNSPGLKAVFRKELADHFTSRRFIILFALVAIAGLSSSYVATQTIRSNVTEAAASGFVFLRLFSAGGNSLPPFTSFIGFLGPLVGLALGFDAINGERTKRTLSRLVSQPIHRDSIINGKFAAGITIISFMVLALFMVVGGLGLRLIGIPPSFDEAMRIFSFLILSVVYVAFWLSLSMLFSVIFRQMATSALAAIALWLFLTIFLGLLAGLVANIAVPVTQDSPGQTIIANQHIQQNLSRLSPTTLYSEATTVILDPEVRILSPVLVSQVNGAIPGSLPFGQSLLLVWPHLTGLIAATLLCFALSYTMFMGQEVRAI